MVLALDAHGGDFGPDVTIPAALDVLAAQANIEILLCGIPEEVAPVLKSTAHNMYSNTVLNV